MFRFVSPQMTFEAMITLVQPETKNTEEKRRDTKVIMA
jgi:hypothetical protein